MREIEIVKPASAVLSRETLWWRAGISGSLLLALAVLELPLHPRFSICGFLWLTGRPCPFCGLTRAMACLMKGEVMLALSLHPLSPLVALALLMMLLGEPSRRAWERMGWRTLSRDNLQPFWNGSLLAFVAYGVWRICFGEIV